MAFQYTNKKGITYHLHKREVILKGSGKVQTIYFFGKIPGTGAIDDLPEGFEVVENPRTGLPTLRRKK